MNPRPCLLVSVLLSLTTVLRADLPPYPSLQLEALERLPEPVINPASPAAERAIAAFRAPADLEIKLWAAEPLLANPVAFAFDEKGRAFISETHRYRSSVLDIRGYMAMLEQDLASHSLEDRLALIDGVFGAQANDLAIETEVVRLVEDTDGDGVADTSKVFADGFNSKLDGIASGVLARNGKVWFTNIPSLWQFDTDPAGTTATARHELLRGFGVRFGYTGHDFHGLAFGPDGKLYFSIGDRGTNVTTPDGRHIFVPDEGAVFRANPDGSEMEVVATGMRNPQELAFDEFGNLLTGDNDCDNGDLERLVLVVEGGDSGWRVGYQHAPRGRAGPWMSENLWKTDFPGRPAYLLPPLANIEDGPSGITYYPGTGLTSAYDRTLFITHFKGSIARSGVQTYQLEPAGAALKVTRSEPFIWGMLPTDVTFAPDGQFYFVDWVVGWPKSSMGRIYAVTPRNRPAADVRLSQEVNALLAGEIRTADAERLFTLLGHVDQRVRQEAQFELAARLPDLSPLNRTVALDPTKPLLARIHALWALGQRAADFDFERWDELLADPEPEIRAQAAKLLGDHGRAAFYRLLVGLLGDPAERVQFFAAQSLGKLGDPAAGSALVDLLRRNDNRDAYVRHAAVHALFRLAARDALRAAEDDPAPAVRLGALLAYRKLGDARAAVFLADSDPYLVREAALAINDAPIPDALPALAALLGSGDLNDEALQLRILNARHRLGRPADAEALAAFAASDAPSADLREEALVQLAHWAEPFRRDRLVGVYRPLPPRAAAPAVAALESHLSRLLVGTPRGVKQAALRAARVLHATAAIPALRAIVAAATEDGEVRAEALQVLDALQDDRLLDSVQVAGASDSPELRLSTLPILARLSPDEALPILRRMATAGTPEEQQAAFTAIASLASPASADLLVAGLNRLQAGELPYRAQVELLDAAEASTAEDVQAALNRVNDHWLAQGDTLAPYRGALEGGDARRGWRLFNEHPVLACTRCHKANGEGGEAGPDLTTIATRLSPEQLLEAIIDPNATIAEGFDVVAFTLSDGGFESGTILSENAAEIRIRDAEGAIKSIDATKVAERAAAPSSMPAVFGLVLKRTELRDLMAFVRNLKPRETATGEEGEGAGSRAVHGE